MPQRRLILGIVDHQRAVFGQKLIGVHDPRRKHHQREGIFGEAEAAVVEVEDAALGKIAVFVSNLHLLRVLEEVLVRLGLLHRIDQPRILLLVIVKLLQAVDHLPGGEVVVFVVHIVRGLGILAHDGRDHLAVDAVRPHRALADLPPELFGQLVVGVDDRAAEQILVGIAADIRIPVDLPVGDLFAEDHVQRNLKEAAGDHVFVGLVILLLPGDGIAVADRHGADIRVMLLDKGLGHLLPGLPFKALIPGRRRLFRQRAGAEKQQQAERRKQADQLSYLFHTVSIPRSKTYTNSLFYHSWPELQEPEREFRFFQKKLRRPEASGDVFPILLFSR